ncbi:hypothetical protein J2R76_003519 [Bradyrhizobium sp. USDA 4532]|nr:hypothetical protein [Bradyrhizobium sp. USDA 4545]MCP1919928.1 hypothetical protein [Bradyrhizobium sp. USDA 4532]
MGTRAMICVQKTTQLDYCKFSSDAVLRGFAWLFEAKPAD